MLMEAIADHAATLAAIRMVRDGRICMEELGYSDKEQFASDLRSEVGNGRAFGTRLIPMDELLVKATYALPPFAVEPVVGYTVIG